MGFLFSVTFATIFVCVLNGQHVLAAPKWKGMLDPLVPEWDNFDQKSPWHREDPYLENSIDDYGQTAKEYTDLPLIRYYIINVKPVRPQSPTRTLSDLFRSNEINDILGSEGRLYDSKGFSHPVNDFSAPLPRDSVSLIPSALIRSRPFRLATLASIGYGPSFRFY